MITESLIGKVITAKFSLFEWKVINTVLAAIRPINTQPENMLVVTEISKRMLEAGFTGEDYPWIASAFAMEIEMRELASYVIGPLKVTAIQNMVEKAQAEEAVAHGCPVQ